MKRESHTPYKLDQKTNKQTNKQTNKNSKKKDRKIIIKWMKIKCFFFFFLHKRYFWLSTYIFLKVYRL